MRHAHLLEMINTRSQTLRRKRAVLCQSKELTSMLHAGGGIDGIVAVMQLIDHGIRHLAHSRTAVATPPFGIGAAHVNDCTATTVYANSRGKDTRCLLLLVLQQRIPYAERIELPQKVTFDRSLPRAILLTLEPLPAYRCGGFGGLIDT